MLVYLNNIIIYTGLEHTQVLREFLSFLCSNYSELRSPLARAPAGPRPGPRAPARGRPAARGSPAQMYMQLAAVSCGAARGPGCFAPGRSWYHLAHIHPASGLSIYTRACGVRDE